MSPASVKAQHYLQLLDDARCESNWDSIPELVRKIRKHAPERICLASTAETEHAVAKAAQTTNPPTRPLTTVIKPDFGALLDRVPKLLAAADAEEHYPEDKFQALVCAGWLHWVAGEYDNATSQLPKNVDQAYAQFETVGGISQWTRVCTLKAAHLKANCMARKGLRSEALRGLESSLPRLSSLWHNPASNKQLRYWAELFLTEYCVLFSQAIGDQARSLNDPNCLACFRSWSQFWESQGAAVAGGYGPRGATPRRRIWLEYYDIISEILKQDLPFPTGYASVNNDSSARSQLRMELKKVEAKYEALLLSETLFPRAEEQREEVEAFVELVMENWNLMNGRGWREHDLGQGGKESLSRGVLDILYRAAMKTFHSTAILRHLFTVHLAVAEFDLAFKSFDSYLDLIKRGKARVEKTGHPEPSLDDDATVLETISSCIISLCRYGDRQAAEKARSLAAELEHMLNKLKQPQANQEDGISPLREDGHDAAPQLQVGPSVLALSWQSMGLAHAQWARMTFDAASRSDIQNRAILCLRKSLSGEFGRSADVRGVFALGLLLAEQRELSTGIELVKTALLAEKAPGQDHELYHGSFWRERSLVPLWHLLSLMLSARQDYVMAARACEGAFEQFKDATVLFGGKHLHGSFRSDHLKEVEARKDKDKDDGATGGVVDDMDDYEKESILEVKMTQLALVELLEGPKIAVNASLELLSLFSRLFGVPQPKVATLNPPRTTENPKSSAGTLRSIKGSLFGSKSERTGRTRPSVMNNERPSTAVTRPQTTQTIDSVIAPTIQITNENGFPPETRQSRKSASLTRGKESGSKRANLRKRETSGSRRRAVSSGSVSHQPSIHDGEGYFTPFEESASPKHGFFSVATKRFPSGGNKTASRTDPYASNESAKPRATDSLGISVEKLEPSATLLPVIQFSKDHYTRRRSAILIKVWLMIAGFYRRANTFEDSQGAISEAMKLVQTLEAEIAKDTTGALSLKQAGWAGKKSVEELWGDVWTEKGNLSLAKDMPYTARSDFESALTHWADHPGAIVGLSNILLDMYAEIILPPPAVPGLDSVITAAGSSSTAVSTVDLSVRNNQLHRFPELPCEPLGLGTNKAKTEYAKTNGSNATAHTQGDELPPPYKAKSLPLVDRLAARDRAYGLLSGLTKLGTGWNYSEAWFALARAHEESGQADKAKEVLWWCVELEEGIGVREWTSVGLGGYAL